MSSPLDAAIRGALVGATLGAPLRGAITWRPITFYQPIPTRMAQSDSLDAWLVAAGCLREGTMPQQVSEAFAQHFSSTTSPPVARFQLSIGLRAPLSGSFRSSDPENSEAFGRALVWGMLFPGGLAQAREFAWYDAASDHAGEGVWCAVACASLLSATLGGARLERAVQLALETLPPESKGRKVAHWVLDAKEQSTPAADFHKELPHKLNTTDPQNAVLNLGWILSGLLLSKDTFDDAICTAVGCGGSADQVGMVVGAVTAARIAEVPDEWLRPLGDRYVAGPALLHIEPPATIEEFGQLVASSARLVTMAAVTTDDSPTEPAPSEVAGPDGDGTAPPPTASTEESSSDQPVPIGEHEEPAPFAETKPAEPARAKDLPPAFPSSDTTVMVAGDIVVFVQFIDPPVAFRERSIRMNIALLNPTRQDRVIEMQLITPAGWQVATRLGSFRLRSGEKVCIAAVVRPTDLHGDQSTLSFGLRVNDQHVNVPILPSQEWYWVGPFPNIEGEGFDRTYRAEDVLNTREVFNGRSNLGIRWQAEQFPGVIFDLEDKFANGPGVVYLYLRCQFPEREKLRIICAASTGVVVTIDRQKVLWYHDAHVPIPRPVQPYVAEFVPGDETHILVKVLRNKQPLLPLVMYFLRPDGTLVVPKRSLPMDAS